MKSNPSLFVNDENQPVEQITPELAQDFLKGFEDKTGWPVRLPTEAEWEYVCRELGQEIRFGNGTMVAKPDEMAFQAQAQGKSQYSMVKSDTKFHSFGSSWKQTVPVRFFKPNNIGFYNLSGNVDELLSDYWSPTAYDHAKEWNPEQKKTDGNQFKVKRGGSWFAGAADLRCSKRSFSKPDENKSTLGMRMVWEGPK